MERESILKKIQESKDLDWYQKFEVIKNSGIFTPGWAKVDPEYFLNEIGLRPIFFKNKRVLDLGADAGAYSYFLEDNSAIVIALDPRDPDKNGFNIIKSIRESNVKYIRESIYNIDQKKIGYFDIILAVNLSPLLKHPLLAMEKINSISKKNTLFVGTWKCCDTWFPTQDVDEVHQCGVNFDKITKKKIRNKSILTAPKLNDISICGCGSASYEKHHFFYPNISCFIKWLEISGFKAELLKPKKSPLRTKGKKRKRNNQIKIPQNFDDLKRWYTDRIRRRRRLTILYFRAIYSGPVELEYGERQLQLS